MDLATKLTSWPWPLKAMLAPGVITSRGSSGCHSPLAVGLPKVMVTASPLIGLSTGLPSASSSGTKNCTLVVVGPDSSA
ncbi:hypothetical protein D9M69_303620 [compost metagenome]